jgi:hypothetical protein
MKRHSAFAIAAMALLPSLFGAAEQAAAQSPIPLAVEVRADAAFPTGSGGFADLAENGVGFGVNVALQLIPNLGIYGGYSRTTFDLDVPGNARAVDSGFSVGLTTAIPGFGPAIMPYLGAGLLFHDLELENVITPVTADGQLGFEVGGGLAIALLPRVRLTPGVGFRRYQAQFIGNQRETISYFTGGLGLNLAF